MAFDQNGLSIGLSLDFFPSTFYLSIYHLLYIQLKYMCYLYSNTHKNSRWRGKKTHTKIKECPKKEITESPLVLLHLCKNFVIWCNGLTNIRSNEQTRTHTHRIWYICQAEALNFTYAQKLKTFKRQREKKAEEERKKENMRILYIMKTNLLNKWTKRSDRFISDTVYQQHPSVHLFIYLSPFNSASHIHRHINWI